MVIIPSYGICLTSHEPICEQQTADQKVSYYYRNLYNKKNMSSIYLSHSFTISSDKSTKFRLYH